MTNGKRFKRKKLLRESSEAPKWQKWEYKGVNKQQQR